MKQTLWLTVLAVLMVGGVIADQKQQAPRPAVAEEDQMDTAFPDPPKKDEPGVVELESAAIDIAMLGEPTITTVSGCFVCISGVDCSNPANHYQLCSQGVSGGCCTCQFCDGAWRCTDPEPC